MKLEQSLVDSLQYNFNLCRGNARKTLMRKTDQKSLKLSLINKDDR